MAERQTRSWAVLLAGALALLILALGWLVWQGRDDASVAARTAAAAVDVVEDIPEPRLPQAPRIPDNPLPQPR